MGVAKLSVASAYTDANKLIMRSLSLSSPRFAACGATSGSPDATSDAPKEIKNVAAKKKPGPSSRHFN